MLQGKRALVHGVANARSIAWGIADRWRREGAEVFVTYQNERFRQPVEKLLRERWGLSDAKGGAAYIPTAACDVTSEEDLAALWRTLQERGLCSSGDSAFETRTPSQADHARAGGGMSDVLAAAENEHRRQGWPAHCGSGSEEIDKREGEAETVEAGGWGGVAGKGIVQPGRKIDIVLHSVAHAPSSAMRQGFLMGTTREAFVSAHVVSAYSLVSTVRHALPFLSPGASVVALTYIGSQRVATNYNVMGPAKASLESCVRALAAELGAGRYQEAPSAGGGSGPESAPRAPPAAVGPGGVRVNCLSPGPLRTMASRGIVGFDEMRRVAAARAPLDAPEAGGAELEEIAGVATFLASSLSTAVTGQTVYADYGFSAVV